MTATPVTMVPIVPARVERTITATDAAKVAHASAGGVEGGRKVRVGLTARHPSAFAQYGPVTFHKISERVSPNGLHRTPIRGQVLTLTEAQIDAALSVARFQMVRAIGGWAKPARCQEYDVRHVGVGYVSRDDRPVLVYHGSAEGPIEREKIDWDASLIYLQENPTQDEAPPESLEQAVKEFSKGQDLYTVSFGAPVPAPTDAGAKIDAGVSEVMGRAKARGLKVGPAGEVRS